VIGPNLKKEDIKMRNKIVVLGTALLLAALGAACGGAGGETPSPTSSPQPIDTPREIRGGELQRMVLRQTDLGPAYQNFVLDEESGFVSKERRAENAANAADEEQDLDRFGYLNSYVEEYSEPSFVDPEAPLPAEGPVFIDTEVLLFGDAAGAAGFIADDLTDEMGYVGLAVFGGRLESFDEFDVAGVGDAAWGGRERVVFEDESGEEFRYYLTGIEVQRGQLVGFVVLLRVDDEDVSTEAISLARQLDGRIQVVLAGET